MAFGKLIVYLTAIRCAITRRSFVVSKDSVGLTPIANSNCVKEGRYLETEAAYFAALHEGDNVINNLMRVDLSTVPLPNDGMKWASEEAFFHWYEMVETSLTSFFNYPSFRSIVAKHKKKTAKENRFIWCFTQPKIRDHVSVHTLAAQDPSTDVLSRVADIAYGPYFRVDKPRWQVHIFRYTSHGQPQDTTEAVFVYLRVGHMLVDGVSLVSILLTSIFGETTPPPVEARSTATFPNLAVAAIQETDANSPSRKLPFIGRFDVPLARTKDACKKLTSTWEGTRVTLTTLVQTVVLRVLARQKGKEALQLAMPRDPRGAQLNRIRNVTDFRKALGEFASDIEQGGPTVIASGAAHQVKSGCNADDATLESWKSCYGKMSDALEERYHAGAQDFIEHKFSVRVRTKLYKLASLKKQTWMLSSINAGPQHSTLGGAYIDQSTVFLRPGDTFKRVVMLLASGDSLSFGVIGHDLESDSQNFAEALQAEMEEIFALVDSSTPK
eukprot:TRINITY_DN8529_c0_g1_i1.p1 TRINITY_DN8529_c0_g1~~TRINITY_DN8529_c0_g1_i1.p1  ORF type:complete len:498 (-),score=43.85 TRINITY_DN8529_c0_g1_i1:82-1575(-)